jgi:hypothetical protein
MATMQAITRQMAVVLGIGSSGRPRRGGSNDRTTWHILIRATHY